MNTGRPTVSRARALLAGALLVVAYGALLRLDALTLTYGPVDRPAWLGAVQQTRGQDSAIRPAGLTWTPATGRYISDPYTYLQYAREMRGFYDAHHREPLFPFATKVSLRLLGDHDVAVSFASAFFSVLAIAATYLLGALAFSPVVGLGAALLLAIEYDVITWGIGGWRDDAFTFGAVLSAYSMVRYVRGPSQGNALLLGAVAGFACLVRITSLSFLIPGLAYVLLASGAPWKARLPHAGLGAAVMALLVAPFLLSCWIAFGDPLYAINVHADVYRETEGQVIDTSQTAAQYLAGTARTAPLQTLDTAILGMTSYPFTNKWQGFEPWRPGLGRWVSAAALAGLLFWIGSPAGRLLLIVIAASLVPYAFTWRLISDWRFTAHVYPFFLIAACAVPWYAATLLGPSHLRRLRHVGPGWRAAASRTVAVAIVFAALWFVTRTLPVMVVDEALGAGQDVTIMAGGRDRAFFRRGWSGVMMDGNVTARANVARRSDLLVPLWRDRAYSATVRLDPHPRPAGDEAHDLPRIRVFLNGAPLATFDLGWNPVRVGAYDLVIPRGAARDGMNRVTFAADSAEAGEEAPSFRLWYIRLRPGPAESGPDDPDAAAVTRERPPSARVWLPPSGGRAAADLGFRSSPLVA